MLIFVSIVVGTFIDIFIYFRYNFIVKNFKAPIEEVGMILGNPKYLEIPVDNVKREAIEAEDVSTSTTSIGPATSTVELFKWVIYLVPILVLIS